MITNFFIYIKYNITYIMSYILLLHLKKYNIKIKEKKEQKKYNIMSAAQTLQRQFRGKY